MAPNQLKESAFGWSFQAFYQSYGTLIVGRWFYP